MRTTTVAKSLDQLRASRPAGWWDDLGNEGDVAPDSLVAEHTPPPLVHAGRRIAAVPNPFNPRTEVHFFVSRPGRVEVFVGDGRDAVVVGPVEPAPENRELAPLGIVGSSVTSLSITGISFRNLSKAVEAGGTATVDVSDCSFIGGWTGVETIGSGWLTVRDCMFVDYQDAAVMVFRIFNPQGALVERCQFYDCAYGVDFQPDNCSVRDCTFDGQGRGDVGVQVSFGGSALIEWCTFAAHENVGVTVRGGSSLHLYDCVFGSDMPENVKVEGLLRGSRNQLGGGTYATLEFTRLSTIEFHGNHILNAGGYSVRASSGPAPVKHFDLSGNYWGTTDTAQLDEWIYDHYDRPTEWFAIVDYLPLVGFPIPAEASSIGRLKSRYSGH